jgi:tripartite ATP-independent transporter DctP family solute receptor
MIVSTTLAAFALGLAAIAGPEPVFLRLAEIHPDSHPTARADYEFARLVGQRSGGRIRVVVYTDASLGQEKAVMEQVRFGAIDIARVSLAAVAGYAPRLNALSMPYLYRDDEHMWRVLDGPVGKELLSSIRTEGFLGLAYLEAGSRSIYTARRRVQTPSDLKGMRIRVQEFSVLEKVMAAFGARPVPMAFGEIYSAIETGAIDGAENNLPTYLSWHHDQVAPYLILTEHARIPEMMVASVVSFATLSAADRQLIAEAAADAAAYQRGEWAKYEELIADRLRSAGVVVLPVHDLEAWRALARPVYEAQDPAMRALIERIRAAR